VRKLQSAADVLSGDDWSSALSVVEPGYGRGRGMYARSQFFGNGPSGRVSESTILRYHFMRHVHRRLAAARLAIRLYELEHGIEPESLQTLVPEYLDAVPHDPFAPPGEAIKYIKGLSGSAVYSIDEDGQDDGGADWRCNRRDNERDRVLWLNGVPPCD
jgi:hypothetical protein